MPVKRTADETQRFVGKMTIKERRHIVRRNETDASRNRKAREAAIKALYARLKKGARILIGQEPGRRGRLGER